MNVIPFILKNLKKCRKLFAAFLFSFIIGTLFIQLELFILSRFVGCFQLADKTEAFNRCILIFFVMAGVMLLMSINRYYMAYLKEAFINVFQSHMVTEIFAATHAQSSRYFDDEMSGRISSAIMGISGNIVRLYAMINFNFLRPLFSFILALGIIMTFSSLLSLSLMVICVPFFFAIKNLHQRFFELDYKTAAAQNHMKGMLADSLANYKLPKYTGSFFTEQLKFFQTVKKMCYATAEREQYHVFSRSLYHIAESLFTIAGFVIILFFGKRDNISLENIVYAFSCMMSLSFAVQELNHLATQFSGYYGSLKSNLELIYKPLEVKDADNAKPLKVKQNTIEFNNVCFSYLHENPVFANLSLKIPAHQKIGIVGHSGSGKSTLINLLLRTYDVNSGQICISGTDITGVTLHSLHKNIAVVSQDTSLFNRTIMENLRIARPEAADKDIYAAAKLAYIHETIIQMPNGYNSVVGERGIMLSGGERQRLSIARAILQNAPILILDEATSALDSEAEILIEQALNGLIQNKTVLAVAHRLSTLRHMDRIIVLKNGVIIEDGTPQELLSQPDSTFRRLYKLQAGDCLIEEGEL